MVLKAIRRVGIAHQSYDYSGYCPSEITEVFWIIAGAGMTVLKAIRRALPTKIMIKISNYVGIAHQNY